MKNTNFSNRPLFATKADVDLFVNRIEEIERIINSINHRYNTVIFGLRGAGKTSLLHRIYFQANQIENVFPVYCDAQLFRENEGGFLTMLLFRSFSELEQRKPLAENLVKKIKEAIALGTKAIPGLGLDIELNRFIKSTRGPAQDTELLDTFERTVSIINSQYGQVAFLVDNLSEDIEFSRKIFVSLRDYFWSLKAVFIVTADQSVEESLLRPPVRSFFETTIRLGNLTIEDTIHSLLLRGLQDQKLAAQIYEASHGNPMRAIMIARRLANREIQNEELALLIRRNSELYSNLKDLERDIVNYIFERGPVSASDKDFQSHMRVSRVRLVQILKILKEKNVLTSKAKGKRVYYALKINPLVPQGRRL